MVKRQDLYVVAILAGMGVYVGSLYWLLHAQVGLTAFPKAMLAGRVVFMVLCYLFVAWLAHRRRWQAPARAAASRPPEGSD